MTGSPRSTGTVVVAWLFVAAQFGLIAVMVFPPVEAAVEFGTLAQNVAIGFKIAGAVLGLWAAVYLGRGLTPSPLPNGATELVVAGPYRWARHPMYVAVMLYMFGVGIQSLSWLTVGAFALLVALFNVKARWEEGHLSETFPGYAGYIDDTPRFIMSPAWRH